MVLGKHDNLVNKDLPTLSQSSPESFPAPGSHSVSPVQFRVGGAMEPRLDFNCSISVPVIPEPQPPNGTPSGPFGPGPAPVRPRSGPGPQTEGPSTPSTPNT